MLPALHLHQGIFARTNNIFLLDILGSNLFELILLPLSLSSAHSQSVFSSLLGSEWIGRRGLRTSSSSIDNGYYESRSWATGVRSSITGRAVQFL
jgi:hypothetical protein